MIKEYIERMKVAIPVEWDRFTETGGTHNIYGWIKRSDGPRDFLLLQIWIIEGDMQIWFCTSSAKSSSVIFEYIYGFTSGHNTCKKINELKV